MSKQIFQVRDFSGRKIVDVRADSEGQVRDFIAKGLEIGPLDDRAIANLAREGISIVDAE